MLIKGRNTDDSAGNSLRGLPNRQISARQRFPIVSFAGEPAWWTKMKQDCLNSGGQLSSRYLNSWTGCRYGTRSGISGGGGAEQRAREAEEARVRFGIPQVVDLR